MAYLFVGYFVLWALTFGYLFILGARQKQLQRDLERLRQERSASEAPVPESS
jgi:CcmD family protein